MLIEVSGIDGSGKSTALHRLLSFLSARDIECQELVLRSTGKLFLDDIARDAGLRSWREMFSADEVETSQAIEMLGQVHAILGPLAQNHVLVTDTYIARWLATAMRAGAANTRHLALLYAKFPVPVVSFHLGLPVELAHTRLANRPKGDPLLDGGDGLRKLAQYTDAFASAMSLMPYPQVRLNAAVSSDEVLDEMLRVLRTCSVLGPRVAGNSHYPKQGVPS